MTPEEHAYIAHRKYLRDIWATANQDSATRNGMPQRHIADEIRAHEAEVRAEYQKGWPCGGILKTDPYRGDDEARDGDAEADQLEDDARIERAERRENEHEKNRSET